MTDIYDYSPDASDDEDNQTKYFEEYAPFRDVPTLLKKPAHLSLFLNYTISQNRPNYLLFVLCIHHLQRHEKSKDFRKAANEIFTDFLNPSAVLRVTFPKDVVDEITINLHQQKDPKQLQFVYDNALKIATRNVNATIREFKNKLDMGLGTAYNVQALEGLDTFEDETRVAKQILLEKFEELQKDTNELHEEKNKALIAAVNYFLEDIGIISPSAIARSFSLNKRDVEKLSKKLSNLRSKDNPSRGISTFNPLNKPKDVEIGVDGSLENVHSGTSTSNETVDEDDIIDKRLLHTAGDPASVKRSKSLPKDPYSVQPKRPHSGAIRPKSAAEESDMFASSLASKRQSMTSEELHSSNSSDGSNRGAFASDSGSISDPRRCSRIIYEPDPDMEIPYEMVLWSQHNGQLIKTRSMNKKQIQRQDVISEFIHTEQHYVRKLKVLTTVYYNPLMDHNLMEKVQIIWLFPNLDELIKLHKEFCLELLARQKAQPRVMEITDLINRHLRRYELKDACAKFCNHQKSALAMFKYELNHSPDLAGFVHEAEMHPLSKRLDLDQLIGCVLQRITKYPLLLDQLKKCTQKEDSLADYNSLTESIGLAKDLATFVNLRIKETENAARLESLHQKIDNQILEGNPAMGHFSNLRITAPRRKLLYDGPLTLTSRTGSLEILALLMTDCIVLLQKQDSRYLLKPLSLGAVEEGIPDKSPVVMLNEIHIPESSRDKKDRKFVFVNTSKHCPGMYTMKCTNKDQKETWFQNLSVALEQFKSSHSRPISIGIPKHIPQAAFGPQDEISEESEDESESEDEEASEEDEETEESLTVNHDEEPEVESTTPTLILHHPEHLREKERSLAREKERSPAREKERSPAREKERSARERESSPAAEVKPAPSSVVPPERTRERSSPVKAGSVEYSELDSQELVLRAMNENRQIHKLSIPSDTPPEEVLRQIQRASVGLSKTLKQLMITIRESEK